jgi:hypothetical protein
MSCYLFRWAALPQSQIEIEAGVFWFVLLSVTSWIVLSLLDNRNDPRSHTN